MSAQHQKDVHLKLKSVNKMSIFPDTSELSLYRKMIEWYYWFRAWFTNPSNVLFLDITPTWHDKTDLIRLAVFKYLVKFVEEEKPFKSKDCTSDVAHREVADKLLKAYKWITVEREKAVANYDELRHKIYGGTSFKDFGAVSYADVKKVQAAEEYYLNKDQEILHMIIDIRYSLWT